MKDAYYFSHDSNARNDEKILMLRAEHGWQGYGLFWALVEMMFEAKETCLCHSKVKGIAISYNVDITLLESVINTCISERLFVSDGTMFWSETLRQRKKKFLELRQQKSAAGKKGMAKRWGSDNTVITENNKGKEKKRKEKKRKENKEELIVLTADEQRFIETLQEVKNYPQDREKDRELYQTLTDRYPDLDILDVARDWAAYKLDKPLDSKANPRSQLNTACKKSLEWGKNLKKPRGDPKKKQFCHVHKDEDLQTAIKRKTINLD